MKRTLSEQELKAIDACWRAANYLSVGQIYLLDNPLLKEALKIEHVKPRLLGHWGTTPMIYIAPRPGHAGSAGMEVARLAWP